jgi:hypothetical protein
LAQTAQDTVATTAGKIYLITKFDGIKYTGRLIKMDAREVLIATSTVGELIIPKHEIKEMRLLKDEELSSTGSYLPEEPFATRYFISTNGLPVKKGESYILWNWYGPDFQFGLGKNFGAGIMTSWLGMPIIGSAKYSIEAGKDLHFAVGALVGTGSWALPEFGLAVPFASATVGNRRNNLTVSGGYGALWGYGINGGRMLCSVAGMAHFSPKVSLVFDSFIMPGIGDNSQLGLYMPGLRFQTDQKRALQIGFAGLVTGSGTTAVPMIQLFRML